MNFATKKILIISSFLLMAAYLGLKLGSGEWGLAVLLILILSWYLLQRLLNVQQEAIILAFLVFGYIVGNRGFAQITPIGNLPVFFGELFLFYGLGLLLLKTSFKKNVPFHLDTLGIYLLLWIFFGALRTAFDLRQYGLMALRDFATVYYALYFFIAQSLTRHLPSRKFFERVLGLGVILVLPLFILFEHYPEIFFYKLRIDNTPLIFYKGDLPPIAAGMGFIFFYFKYLRGKFWPFLLISAICFLMTLYSTARAAWVGLALALILILAARLHKIVAHLYLLVVLSIVPLTVYLGFVADDYRQTRIYAIVEHVESLVDISGTATYKNRESRGTGKNNRFRLVWWQTIIEETMRHAPFVGLGFGYDLSSRFVKNYYGFLDKFTVRSPHSIILTVFGRMGILGLLLFSFIIIAMVNRTWRAILKTRLEGVPSEAFGYWCMVWVIFGSACFGVVLEGPMGAIPFWTFLGLANALTYEESPVYAGEKSAALIPRPSIHPAV